VYQLKNALALDIIPTTLQKVGHVLRDVLDGTVGIDHKEEAFPSLEEKLSGHFGRHEVLSRRRHLPLLHCAAQPAVVLNLTDLVHGLLENGALVRFHRQGVNVHQAG